MKSGITIRRSISAIETQAKEEKEIISRNINYRFKNVSGGCSICPPLMSLYDFHWKHLFHKNFFLIAQEYKDLL